MIEFNVPRIIHDIDEYIHNDQEYWDFKSANQSERDFMHGICTYPAMMVPKMQRRLLEITCNHVVAHSKKRLDLLDPFVGSGTVMLEGMLLGLNVTGIDLNPLAILLSKVKTTIIPIQILQDKSNELLNRLEENSTEYNNVFFEGINKWFSAQSIKELSKLKRAIQQESDVIYRRFFWAAFCDVVRMVSFSKDCTYKLHIKSYEDRMSFNKNSILLFRERLESNIRNYIEFYCELTNRKLIRINKQGIPSYRGKVKIILGNTLNVLQSSKKHFDIIQTSPPYGDNHTTVSYGQYSVLPLRWINIHDIDENVEPYLIETLSRIDVVSLGGKNDSINFFKKRESLIEKSNSLRDQLEEIEDIAGKKVRKIVYFYYDFEKATEIILRRLDPGGLSIWTVGNRKVAKQEIYMHTILSDFHERYNSHLEIHFTRKISKKRMPETTYRGINDDNITTMNREQILFFRKG